MAATCSCDGWRSDSPKCSNKSPEICSEAMDCRDAVEEAVEKPQLQIVYAWRKEKDLVSLNAFVINSL